MSEREEVRVRTHNILVIWTKLMEITGHKIQRLQMIPNYKSICNGSKLVDRKQTVCWRLFVFL
ncbi:hypothetical protein Lacidipiscis_00951 [Ligilactobacillus acidipiscis]|nr:hypothetical protein Lacidipiscis_00951 [Ligilactobacillus acidipiscis]